MITRLRSNTAKSSGGPNCMTRKAMGNIMRIVKISLVVSPKTDENSAISSAFRDLPCWVNLIAVRDVATAAPVPGMEIKIAGMLPPNMPPL